MASQIGYVKATFEADVANFIKDIGKAADSMESTQKRIGGSVEKLQKTLEHIAEALMLEKAAEVFTEALKEGINIATQAEKINAKLAQTIKNTGETSGVTVEQVDKLTESMVQLSGQSPEVVKAGEQILATYKHISSQVFPEATKAMMDLSAGMGIDAATAAAKLGKALENPASGLKSLRSLGIILTEQQKEQIKTFQEQNDVLDAQKLILDIIENKYEGMSAVVRDTLDGSLKALHVSFEELDKALVQGKGMGSLRFGIELAITAVNDLTDAFKTSKEEVLKSLASKKERTIWDDIGDSIGRLTRETVNWFIAGVQTIGSLTQFGMDQIDLLSKCKWDFSQFNKSWAAAKKHAEDDFEYDFVGGFLGRMNKAVDETKKRMDKLQKDAQTAKYEPGQASIGAGSSKETPDVAALGIPTPKQLEDALAKDAEILGKYDLSKVFAGKVEKIDVSQLSKMREDSTKLLEDVKAKIATLQRAKSQVTDKDAKAGIQDQITQYKDLQKELEGRNKDLDSQWQLVDKNTESVRKLTDEWKKRSADAVLAAQADYTRGQASIKAVWEEIAALQQKGKLSQDVLNHDEAEKKAAELTNLTIEQRKNIIQKLTDAYNALSEAKAEKGAEDELKKDREDNELLKAKVAGLEDEYLAQKKLNDLIKDIQDPTKKNEYINQLKAQADQTKALNDQLKKQSDFLEQLKSSHDSYFQKQKQLSDAWQKGIINAKQYTQTLADLQKQQIANVSKGVTDWTNKLFDGLANAITSGKKLTDVFKDLGKELGLLAAKKLLFEPIANAIGNWAGKLYGGTMFGAPSAVAGAPNSGSAIPAVAGLPPGGGIGGLLGGLFGLGKKPFSPIPGTNNTPGGTNPATQPNTSMDTLNRIAAQCLDQLMAIRNTLDFTKIQSAQGLAIKAWLVHPELNGLGSAQAAQQSSGATPFSKASGLSPKSSPMLNGGVGGMDLSSLMPAVAPLIGTASDGGPAWRVLPIGGNSLAGAQGAGGGAGGTIPSGSPASSGGTTPNSDYWNITHSGKTGSQIQADLAKAGYGSPQTGITDQSLGNGGTSWALKAAAQQANTYYQGQVQSGNMSSGQYQQMQGVWDNTLQTQAAKQWSLSASQVANMIPGKSLQPSYGGYSGGVSGGSLPVQVNMSPEQPQFTPGLTGAGSGASIFRNNTGGSGVQNYKWNTPPIDQWANRPDTGGWEEGGYYQDVSPVGYRSLMPIPDLSYAGYAAGGDPAVGIPSIVGERGPELFVPRQSGTVLPNDRLKEVMGGSSSTPVVHLHDYTSTQSQISGTHQASDGSLHITLRDAMSTALNDPKAQRQIARNTGTKPRGYRRG